MQDFRNLVVWQESRRFTRSIYDLSTRFPGSETFGLQAQMRRASVSICSNIAEGCGRRGDREFRRFLNVAMGSACELECEIIIACDLSFIPEAAQNEAVRTLITIKRMLAGLMSRLKIRSANHRKLSRRLTAES